MTDEELKAIEDREAEHQREHNDGASSMMESCLPGGCSPDDSDIVALIVEVKRLRSYEAASNRIAALLGESAEIMAYGDQEPDA